MKKRFVLAVLSFIGFIIVIFLLVFAYDFYRVKNSIQVSNQPFTDTLIIKSVNMPSYGFIQVSQINKENTQSLSVGASSFLTKGQHQDVNVTVFKEATERISASNQTFIVKLIADTTGDRVPDFEDDKPMQSVFGFLYQKTFLRQ